MTLKRGGQLPMNSKQSNVKRKHRKAKNRLRKFKRLIARKIEVTWASGSIAEEDLFFLKQQLKHHGRVKKFMQIRQHKSEDGHFVVSIVTTRKLYDDERSRFRTFLRYAECCPNLKLS